MKAKQSLKYQSWQWTTSTVRAQQTINYCYHFFFVFHANVMAHRAEHDRDCDSDQEDTDRDGVIGRVRLKAHTDTKVAPRGLPWLP
eukprot:3500906-Amphidinium_carterae.1